MSAKSPRLASFNLKSKEKMRLKRGVVRESCDLCHRRKIKCDRAVRIARGREGCSQCGIRQIACSVDSSNDIRLQRQNRYSGASYTAQDPASHVAVSPDAVGDTQAALSQPLAATQLSTPIELTPPCSFFDLNADSIFFLDQIFMGDLSTNVLDSQMPDFGFQIDQPNTPDDFSSAWPSMAHDSLSSGRDLWTSCNTDATTFVAALDAYFKYAALALPILFADAFWTDYQIGRGSDALVYAVACRGMPFLPVSNKWTLQQNIARRFKECFFERQQAASQGGSPKLDDVEALALMVDFHYDTTSAPSPFSHLESLFLSHDSLVLSTLQCRVRSTGSDEPESLTVAAERLALLFWHVYGLDAFHSLDHKLVSRIPESELDATTVVPQSDAAGYLDAILGLAVIARHIFQLLSSTQARRNGVQWKHLNILYRRIKTWRNDSCPLYLQRHLGANGEISVQDDAGESRSSQSTQLRRTVLWMLEINCYMQIESCVDSYGIQTTGSALSDELVAVEVQKETLRTVHEATRVLKWLKKTEDINTAASRFALADLSPSIVRPIFAGLSYWLCVNSKKLARQPLDASLAYQVKQAREETKQDADADVTGRSCAQSYLEISSEFRDVVASAVSHQDTANLFQRLDDFIASVRAGN